MSRSIVRHAVVVTGLLGALVVAAACGSATPTAPPSAVAPTVAPTASPAAAAACTPKQVKLDPATTPDLTGLYAANDGGIYYVRQRGNVVWWNGMSSRDGSPQLLGRDWNNVGRGELGKDLTIKADWVDVPRGKIQGYGTVDFKVLADADGNLRIVKTTETGTGRGDSVWTPCMPAT